VNATVPKDVWLKRSEQCQWVHIHQHGGLRDFVRIAKGQRARQHFVSNVALATSAETESDAPFQARQRGRSRSQNTQPFSILRRKILRKLARPPNYIFEFCIPHNHIGKRCEWRIGHHAAKCNRARRTTRSPGAPHPESRMLRVVGLNEHAAGRSPAPRAPRHLREQLNVRSRRGSRAGSARNPRITPDQRDALEVVALGEHLRAHQNIQRATGERAQRFLVLLLVRAVSRSSRAIRAPEIPCAGVLPGARSLHRRNRHTSSHTSGTPRHDWSSRNSGTPAVRLLW